MGWSGIRRWARGTALVALAVPLGGCALLGSSSAGYTLFEEPAPGPATTYTDGRATLSLSGGETAEVELSLVGGRYDPMIGASLDLRDDTGWAVTVAVYAPSMGSMTPPGFVSVHRVADRTHLVASDWTGICDHELDRSDASGVRASVVCQGMRWMDAIAMTSYGPVDEGFIGEPFDARIAIDVEGPGPSPTPTMSPSAPALTHCLTLAVGDDGAPVDQAVLTATRAIIALRLDRLGAEGVTVVPTGDDALIVGLPDGDVDAWTAAATRPGVLALVPIPEEYDQQVIDGARLPPGMDATPLLTHADIAAAGTGTSPIGRPTVDLQLTPGGAVVFDAWAADHVGRRFAIVLDGVVVSAPVINETRYGGQAQISGDFTEAEAAQIATALGTGPLPATVSVTATSAAVDGSCPT